MSIDAEIRQGAWISSPSSYAAFLVRTLRFHRIVEDAVAPFVNRIDGLVDAYRPRCPLLEGDLGALADAGVFPNLWPERSPAGAVGPLLISGPAAALGALYVVEGSRLGGVVLARWIEDRLGYDSVHGASGFAAPPESVSQRWRAFGALIEAWVAAAPEDLDAMAAAAAATFAVAHLLIATAASGAELVSA